MGLKISGFVCDRCHIFHEYSSSRSSISCKYPQFCIPPGWSVISDHKVIDNWVYTNGKEVKLFCFKCSRELKIRRIQNGISKKTKDKNTC